MALKKKIMIKHLKTVRWLFALLIILFSSSLAYAGLLKTLPDNFTVQTGGEARFLLFLPEGSTFFAGDIQVEGLPPDFSYQISCTGGKGEKCNTPAGSDDLPLYILKIAIPPHAEAKPYSVAVSWHHAGTLSTSKAILDVRDKIDFIHPGVMLNTEMLARIKSQVLAGNPTLNSALTLAAQSQYGSKSYQPSPHRSVAADGSEATDLRNDAIAAYTQALLWSLTQDKAYAENAIRIMNAWSETFSAEFTGNNRFNLAAWTGDLWPRAAEIIRYTCKNNNGTSCWADEEIERFREMLDNYYARFIQQGFYSSGQYGGNLIASQAAALINIGVFNDDSALFLAGIEKWRRMLPAYIYMKQDGNIPAPPAFWRNSYINRPHLTGPAGYWYGQDLGTEETGPGGISQETCRDLGHVLWGFSALANGSETARIQGVDLHAESTLGTPNVARLAAGMEFNLVLLNRAGNAPALEVPEALCGGSIKTGQSTGKGEILFNDLTRRRGMTLAESSRYLATQRPTLASYFMVWETLTHFNNP